jgi:hypothetical protein
MITFRCTSMTLKAISSLKEMTLSVYSRSLSVARVMLVEMGFSRVLLYWIILSWKIAIEI